MNNQPGKDYSAAKRYYHEREARRRAQREQARQLWLARAREVIAQLAPQYPALTRVILYGSLVQPGRFLPDSDIDVAVVCESPEVESAFWRALEQALHRDIDLRPLTGVIAEIAAQTGKVVYG